LTTIECAPNLGFSRIDVQNAPLYRDWVDKFDPGWVLRRLIVRDGVVQKGAICMLFARATLQDPTGECHTRVVYLRGGTVDTLVVLVTPDGRQFLAFVKEKRFAVGRTFLANSAGMVGEGELPIMTAMREKWERRSTAAKSSATTRSCSTGTSGTFP
jgi:hypothetical protein